MCSAQAHVRFTPESDAECVMVMGSVGAVFVLHRLLHAVFDAPTAPFHRALKFLTIDMIEKWNGPNFDFVCINSKISIWSGLFVSSADGVRLERKRQR